MSEPMDTPELTQKLKTLYESCLIRDQVKDLEKNGISKYLSQRYRDNSFNIGTDRTERKRHLDSYEYAKPKRKVNDDQPKYDPKPDIEQERIGRILDLERPHYKPWMILTVLVTVLCCLGAGLIGVLSVLSKQSSADLAGFVVYIIAAVLVIRSVIFVNPRSKSAAKKDKLSLSPSLPIFPFILLVFPLISWKAFPALLIAVANLALTIFFMSRPTAKAKAELQKKGSVSKLYLATEYVPSPALQKKIEQASRSDEDIYNEELAAFEKKFNAKLDRFDKEIARMEKEMAAEEKVARAKYDADLAKLRQLLPEANRVFEEADFLNPEDKTTECIGFLYKELASGSSKNLKQALSAYDRVCADNRDSLARLHMIAADLEHFMATDRKAKEDEEKLRQDRAKNAAMAREIREQEARIRRELKNK